MSKKLAPEDRQPPTKLAREIARIKYAAASAETRAQVCRFVVQQETMGLSPKTIAAAASEHFKLDITDRTVMQLRRSDTYLRIAQEAKVAGVLAPTEEEELEARERLLEMANDPEFNIIELTRIIKHDDTPPAVKVAAIKVKHDIEEAGKNRKLEIYKMQLTLQGRKLIQRYGFTPTQVVEGLEEQISRCKDPTFKQQLLLTLETSLSPSPEPG